MAQNMTALNVSFCIEVYTPQKKTLQQPLKVYLETFEESLSNSHLPE